MAAIGRLKFGREARDTATVQGARNAGVGVALAALTIFMAPAAALSNPPSTSPFDASSGSPIVVGRSFTIPSKILGGTRTINVYLPDSYGKPGKRFPVLYLLDGGVQEDFLHITGLAQINAAYGAGEEVIVVGIAGVDRQHDLTTPSIVPSDLKAAPTSGGALSYRRFLVDELKPWIAARYLTNGRTALIGESLAGLFTLQTFLDEPSAFSDYIAVSPSLWWNGGRTITDASTKMAAHKYSDQRLWVGFEVPPPPEKEAIKDRRRQDAMERAISKVPHGGLWLKIVHLPEGHGSIYHPAALQAFRALFGKPGK